MRQNILLFFVLLSFCLNLAEYVGNPDDTAIIERPCAVYDIRCIRKFFADHSNCTIATGPVPDPYSRTLSSYYIPRVNTTITQVNQRISGLNGNVEEFYINKDTNNLLIAIDFPLDIRTRDTYYSVHRSAKEPVVTLTSSRIIYQSVVVTAIIPNINDLQLEYVEAFGFINDVSPILVLGPGIFATTDLGSLRSLAEQEDNLGKNVFEQLLTESTFFSSTFIQYNICDFGLRVL